jgi:hypothetical protein
MGQRKVSNDHLGLHHDGLSYAAKLAVGTGISAIGALTLQDWAVVAGIICSVAVTVQTLLNIYFKLKDRRVRRAPGRQPQDE